MVYCCISSAIAPALSLSLALTLSLVPLKYPCYKQPQPYQADAAQENSSLSAASDNSMSTIDDVAVIEELFYC
jgi:hypothetical protein